MKETINMMQAEVDELFKSEGLTDEVLEKQVTINTLRCENDIPDESEFIFEDFVQ